MWLPWSRNSVRQGWPAKSSRFSLLKRPGHTLRSFKLLLFDIDGTLILSGGAGRRAMSLGFKEVTGISGGFDTVSMMGRTDTGILREVLDTHGMRWEEDVVQRFKQSYFRILAEE